MRGRWWLMNKPNACCVRITKCNSSTAGRGMSIGDCIWTDMAPMRRLLNERRNLDMRGWLDVILDEEWRRKWIKA
jgi:hypothetical protein